MPSDLGNHYELAKSNVSIDEGSSRKGEGMPKLWDGLESSF